MATEEKVEEKKKYSKDKKPEEGQQQKSVQQQKREQAIIRIGGVDLAANLTISRALLNIKGFGPRLANIVGEIAAQQLGVAPDTKISTLSEGQIDQLERILANPTALNLPDWIYNKRADYETGTTKHLVSSDLVFDTRQMIERQKNLRTYRGIRHAYGQKVRGQHTKSTGRTGRTVGVIRAKLKPGQLPGGKPGAPGAPGALPGKEEKVSKMSKAATKAAAPAAGAKVEAPKAAAPVKKEEKK